MKNGDKVRVKMKKQKAYTGLEIIGAAGEYVSVKNSSGLVLTFHESDIEIDPEAYKVNPYWDNIQAIADAQRAKGINAYGQGLEVNKELDIEKKLTYLQEELIDALMYVEHVKAQLRGEK